MNAYDFSVYSQSEYVWYHKTERRYRIKETERQIGKEAKKLLDRNHLSEIVRWSIWESLAKLISAKLFSQQVFNQNCLILNAQSKQLKSFDNSTSLAYTYVQEVEQKPTKGGHSSPRPSP